MKMAKMSATASPFRIPEAPQATAELNKDAAQHEDPPGYRSLHFQPHWPRQGRGPHVDKHQTNHLLQLIGLKK